MRKVFEDKLAANLKLRDKISLIPGDAGSFSIERRFPLALLSGVFDHFLTSKERISSLNNIAHHLEPGGTLLFDVFFAGMKDSQLKPAGEVTQGEMTYKRKVGGKIRGNLKHFLLVYEVLRKGKLIERIEQHSRAGVTTHDEVKDLLARTGFKIRAEYSDWEFAPYSQGDGLCIIEAKKYRRNDG